MLTEKIVLNSERNVTLTTYIPDVSDEMSNMKVKPAVLIFPGGAYRFCSDREAEPVALRYNALGFNAFILRYSLNEDAAFPTPLNDACEAYNLILSKCDEWHTDPEKIAVCGFSAGGHLAAALGTMGNPKPCACILGYPCILDSTSPILAKPVPSLEKCVDADTPPCFIFAAADDDLVPVENSLEFASALSKNNVPFEMHIFQRGGHGFSCADEVTMSHEDSRAKCVPNRYWVNRSAEWLKELN